MKIIATPNLQLYDKYFHYFSGQPALPFAFPPIQGDGMLILKLFCLYMTV